MTDSPACNVQHTATTIGLHRRDPVLLAVLGISIGVLLINALPVFGSAFTAQLEEIYFDTLFLSLALLLLAGAVLRSRGRARRFWELALASYGVWWLAWMLSIFLMERGSGPLTFLRDALYAANYALLAMAAALRLDTAPGRIKRTRAIIAASGAVLMVAGLVGYFAMAPSHMRLSGYQTPFAFHVVLDGFLVVLFSIAALRTSRRQWRKVYLLFALASLLILPAEFLSMAVEQNWIEYQPGRLSNAAWYLYYFPVYFAARVALPEPASQRATGQSAVQRGLLHWNPIVAYGFALPLLHLSGYASGLFAAAARPERDWLMLIWVTGLAILFYLQHVLLRRNLRTLEQERRVKTRQARALRERLKQTRRMELLGQLASGMAHDFGNIMTAIDAFVSLIGQAAGNKVSESATRYLRDLRMSVYDAQDLVVKVRAFADRADLPATPLPVAGQAGEITDLLRPTLPADMQLQVEDRAGDTQVALRPGDLNHIVLNLVMNSREALATSGRITVTVERQDIGDLRCDSCGATVTGQWLVLRVADNGPGVPQALRDRLFEPFVTTKPSGQGGGLGLAMVHAVTHHLGGHVSVNHARTRGAEFSVFLPVYPGTATTASVAEPVWSGA